MPDAQDQSDRVLARLISTYLDAHTAWLSTAAPGDDLISGGESFEALEKASRAFLSYPCLTLDAVRRKVSFVLDLPDLYAMVREDEDETDDLLRVFLLSLIAYSPRSGPRY